MASCPLCAVFLNRFLWATCSRHYNDTHFHQILFVRSGMNEILRKLPLMNGALHFYIIN